MTCRLSSLILLWVAVTLWAARLPAAEITVERSEDHVLVKIDGELFTEYLPDVNGTPVLWPIIGPTGKPMTRAYPMSREPNESRDHPHHRSMWFGQNNVNGVNFWEKGGTIKHREFVTVQSKPLIVTRNDWLATDGKKVCEDQRTFTFGTDADTRWIDFDITVKASEGPVTFGDTKEGSFGIRVAPTIKVDARKGGKIINSEGLTNADAWGKQAAWLDYHGPVDEQTVGIAILNHPSSFRFPTYWHVRTGGLFAANPFGVGDFEPGKPTGAHTIPLGETMTLRYRVLLHKGDEKEGKVAEAFAAYSKQEK
jgi:hypothetical protein